MKVKLTKAQREWLEDLSGKPRRRVLFWRPAIAIEGHGFAERRHESYGHAEFRITDAGRQWPKDNPR